MEHVEICANCVDRYVYLSFSREEKNPYVKNELGVKFYDQNRESHEL
jgi:hypothetical protein